MLMNIVSVANRGICSSGIRKSLPAINRAEDRDHFHNDLRILSGRKAVPRQIHPCCGLEGNAVTAIIG